MHTEAKPIPSETDLADLLAAPGQPAIFLDGLAALYRARVGWDMLTLLVFNRERRVGRRVYTTDAAHYPVGAEKPMAESDWSERVLGRHEIFVANRHEEFKAHFVDWEQLRAMGMEAAVNYPIIVDGVALGTVNLTAGARYYAPERVAAGKALAPMAALGFLLIARTAADRSRPR
jgi:hypothetical protein